MIQASLKFYFELAVFHNIDLFNKGYYNIGLGFKQPEKVQWTVSVKQVVSHIADHDGTDRQFIYPSTTTTNNKSSSSLDHDELAVSKTFYIEYQKEKVELHDAFQFSMELLLPSNKPFEWIYSMPFPLQLSLYYYEKDGKPSSWSDLALAVSLDLKLHLLSTGQIHYGRPILFDYLHSSAIEISAHSMLVALQQPNLIYKVIKYGIFTKRSAHIAPSDAAPKQELNLQSILFQNKSSSSSVGKKDFHKALHLFRYWHSNLARSKEQIMTWLQELRHLLQPVESQDLTTLQASTEIKNDTGITNEEVEKLKTQSVQNVSKVLTEKIKILNDKLFQQWTELVEIVSDNPVLEEILLNQHHKQKVKQLNETLFKSKSRRDLLGCYQASKDDGKARILRYIYSSFYLKYLPQLPVHCKDNDGDLGNIPIIFEDIVYTAHNKVRSTINSGSCDGTRSSISLQGIHNHLEDKHLGLRNKSRNGSTRSSKTDTSHNRKSNEVQQSLLRAAIYNSGMQPRPGTVDVKLSPEEYAMMAVLDKISKTDGTSLSPTIESQRVISEVANNEVDCFTFEPPANSPDQSKSRASSSKMSMSEVDFRISSVTSQHTLSNTSLDDVALAFDDAADVFDTNEMLLYTSVPEPGSKFLTAKRNLMELIESLDSFSREKSSLERIESAPYFNSDPSSILSGESHLIICVHGLDGHKTDLRNFRNYLECALPDANLQFLMSEINQDNTFDDMEIMTENLIGEILSFIKREHVDPTRISFIGHSLGTLLIRAALGHRSMSSYLSKLHTFVSLSGPHLGNLFHTSSVINAGMWIMQRWKRSISLLQLSLSDRDDPRETFLYQLSKSEGLSHFKNILLVSSEQDRYVSYHSARIEHCKMSLKDTSDQGKFYSEMIGNILDPLKNSDVNVVRYSVLHNTIESSLNNLIGRAAHIAMLDSELFIEKFIFGCALKYFR